MGKDGKQRGSFREAVNDWSKGDGLWLYWKLFYWRAGGVGPLLGNVMTVLLNRMARRHGGYIGKTAVIESRPSLPHGLHGVYISRYAAIGRDCRIYQNVTIGSVGDKAPRIGDHCLIGAGAVILGDITIGDHVKIGAGAVVFTDVPSHATVVVQPPRILLREEQTAPAEA